jgi:carboxymethylenebutenolidase
MPYQNSIAMLSNSLSKSRSFVCSNTKKSPVAALRTSIRCKVLITESEVTLTTPTGPMRSSLFKPAVCAQGAQFPGIVVYSEIYQVTGPIERICRRLASEGYVVLAGDCYHEYATGSLGYTDDGTTKGNALKTTKALTAFDTDTIATVDYLLGLPECNGKIGAFGLCLGGGLAFRAATVSPHIRAAACHFPTDIHNRGLGPQGVTLPSGTRHSLDSIDSIRGEVLMVWGTQVSSYLGSHPRPCNSFSNRCRIHTSRSRGGQW